MSLLRSAAVQFTVLFLDDGRVRAIETREFMRRDAWPEYATQGADLLRLTILDDDHGLRVSRCEEFRVAFDDRGRQDAARIATARQALAALDVASIAALGSVDEDSMTDVQRRASDAVCRLDTEDYVRALVAAVGERRFAAEYDEFADLWDALADDASPLDPRFDDDASPDSEGWAEMIDLVFDLFFEADAMPRTTVPVRRLN